MMKVKVINKSNFELPNYATEGSAGMDIRANESITLHSGERGIVKTGLYIALPKGYEGSDSS